MVSDDHTQPLDDDDFEDVDEELDLPTVKLAQVVVTTLEPEPSDITTELTKDVLPAELLQAALPFIAESPTTKLVIAKPAKAVARRQPTLGERAIVDSADTPAHVDSTNQPSGELDVARVASIAARLAGGSITTLLARYGVSAESFREAQELWNGRIAEAMERGDSSLRDDYDDAYLEARAAHRGRFDLDAMAELRVELDERIAEPTAPALAIDVADAMRFRRVWARKISANPSVASQLEDALSRARRRRQAK